MGKVLIVDGSGGYRDQIARLLEDNGLVVRSARSSREALQIARAERPDLVLMDIFMPEMDGIHAARTLARDPATESIPVVITAAPAYASHKVRALWLGARDLLIKPLGARALHSVILPLTRPAAVWGHVAVGR